ncbi:hypothetical protein BDQ17DRAFT_1436337 [Cyathus striatus]|nr:hypothetical protein BDQ17DRAFT_1436337 [Cyathus striatus]
MPAPPRHLRRPLCAIHCDSTDMDCLFSMGVVSPAADLRSSSSNTRVRRRIQPRPLQDYKDLIVRLYPSLFKLVTTKHQTSQARVEEGCGNHQLLVTVDADCLLGVMVPYVRRNLIMLLHLLHPTVLRRLLPLLPTGYILAASPGAEEDRFVAPSSSSAPPAGVASNTIWRFSAGGLEKGDGKSQGSRVKGERESEPEREKKEGRESIWAGSISASAGVKRGYGLRSGVGLCLLRRLRLGRERWVELLLRLLWSLPTQTSLRPTAAGALASLPA